MKRRKKVWLVMGLEGNVFKSFSIYRFKRTAVRDADFEGYTRPLRVVPATLEYEVPKKEGIK